MYEAHLMYLLRQRSSNTKKALKWVWSWLNS